jgi:hypothetical protein
VSNYFFVPFDKLRASVVRCSFFVFCGLPLFDGRDKLQAAIAADAVGDNFFEFPTGHLALFQTPCQLIRRDVGVAANMICNGKSFGEFYFAAVKNGVRRRRLVVLATRAATRKGRFAFTIIGVAAFATHKTIFPLLGCQKFQTLLIAGKSCFKLYRLELINQVLHFENIIL